ncbi:A-kinase anchor protein 14 [Antechinus flavipes]|uniref:A-kinase anchor protein 14 n=1 Tax=Antechinus flavipes TaxID=38775 RepID=UPI002235B0E9|nr:A-kinase anchor protein 14 [Antechinus flavipes]
MDKGSFSSNTVEKSMQITEDAIYAAVKTLEDLENPVKNIQWTTCKDFTVDLGRQQIEEYISTWEFHESWLHWSDYLEKEDLEFSVRYHYRVRWSIPTSRKPIPRATACVYFLIEISKIKPKSLPVEVFFVLESNRYVHRPGKSRFREKWLKDIIESKIILMNSINF